MFDIDFSVANISENSLYQFLPEILEILLKDRTTSFYSKKKKNIIWANDNYIGLGKKYGETCPITPDLITGNQGNLIIPRALKSKAQQKERTKSKAEVFTPSWIVKKQNDALDENFKDDDLKTYIGRTWLEITCGEAPYLANRYEMATGELIELNERAGFLDRKLRRINQEIDNPKQWQYWAKKAYQASYGFEWNGDSLLLARENLLLTYCDFYFDKWRCQPKFELLQQIAQIISYNIFQMDGLTCTIPLSQIEKIIIQPADLFNDKEIKTVIKSAGILVKIKDWQTGKLVNFMEITS
ncbi:restriction endonuclease [Faucicola mancuniensis]|uniref:restriction endonuclease n=1 Tax=Faucicola mancuniensis TaxID=1309795 RepID=UPI0028E85FF1|nr:restriction endonuclease [uncultured Moraxella sp.]